MYSTMSKEAWPDWKAEEGQNAEEVRRELSRGELQLAASWLDLK